mmetsp:Transcript_26600/g.50437  ORF Transcript_26600/g.50437 Transcript_26600/m.50437 type:complete len:206 (+) Transcript_26600:2751-3368(+)
MHALGDQTGDSKRETSTPSPHSSGQTAWNRDDRRIFLPTCQPYRIPPRPIDVVPVPRPCPRPFLRPSPRRLPLLRRWAIRAPVVLRACRQHRWQDRPPSTPQFPYLRDDLPLRSPPLLLLLRRRQRRRQIRSTCAAASPPRLPWLMTPRNCIPCRVEFRSESARLCQRRSWEDCRQFHGRSIRRKVPAAASIAIAYSQKVHRIAR